MLSIGLVFLDDLHAVGPWISDRSPAWARQKSLDGPLLPPTITPPPITIIVARTIGWALLEASAPWLRLAEKVIIVLDFSDDPTTKDPDHEDLATYEREELVKLLQTEVHFILATTQTLESAIEEAFRLARETQVRNTWTPFPPLPVSRSANPGPWIDWEIPRRPSLYIDMADVLRLLAPALCRPNGRPALLDGLSGTRIDLQTGQREVVAGLAGASDLWRPIAATPDGKNWLRGVDRNVFRIEGQTPGDEVKGGWGSPIGIDPSGKIAWAGGRCTFHFRLLTKHGPAYWVPSNHDWPSGHGKKLYGYKDNEPQFVVMAPDVSACLSTYEHDALLTPQLPLVWRDVGGFALAERTRGEPRALFFWRSDGDDVFPGNPLEAEEDARDEFAVTTLGPSAKLRYAVSLEKPTYRLALERVERLGGPKEGWIVCNDRHEIVRRHPGRLLGGWGPWVIVEEAGTLRRENIASNHIEGLGAPGKTVHAAVPLAGTPNVVLVNLEEGEEKRIFLRLV